MGDGVILSAFLAALGQLGDRRFLKVVILGLALSLALLAGAYAGLILVIDIFTPDTLSLPWIGEVDGLHTLLGWSSLVAMLVLSIFLMVPVAAAFRGSSWTRWPTRSRRGTIHTCRPRRACPWATRRSMR